MVNDYFKNRKTIRKYSDREVPEKLLRELIEAACEAPTTGGMQLYSVVVTRDAAMKQQLAPHHFFQKMVTDAPVVLTFTVPLTWQFSIVPPLKPATTPTLFFP